MQVLSILNEIIKVKNKFSSFKTRNMHIFVFIIFWACLSAALILSFLFKVLIPYVGRALLEIVVCIYFRCLTYPATLFLEFKLSILQGYASIHFHLQVLSARQSAIYILDTGTSLFQTTNSSLSILQAAPLTIYTCTR